MYRLIVNQAFPQTEKMTFISVLFFRTREMCAKVALAFSPNGHAYETKDDSNILIVDQVPDARAINLMMPEESGKRYPLTIEYRACSSVYLLNACGNNTNIDPAYQPKTRYVVDGFNIKDGTFQGDANDPPFKVFDITRQQHVQPNFVTRADAQNEADKLNAEYTAEKAQAERERIAQTKATQVGLTSSNLRSVVSRDAWGAFKPWRFTAPAKDIDGMRIIRELEEGGHMFALIKIAESGGSKGAPMLVTRGWATHACCDSLGLSLDDISHQLFNTLYLLSLIHI